MAYCVKCGAKVDDGTMSCPQCGAPIPELAGGRSDSRTAGSTADYSQSGGQEYTLTMHCIKMKILLIKIHHKC